MTDPYAVLDQPVTPEEIDEGRARADIFIQIMTGRDVPQPYADLLDLAFWDGLPTQASLRERGLSRRRYLSGLDVGPGWQERMRRAMDETMNMHAVRDVFANQFSFAVPSREILEEIASHSRSIVEVGAGTGFWARLMTKAGIDVVATSPSKYKCQGGTNFKVIDMEASEAVLAYPDRDVLMSWPRRDAVWLTRALAHLRPGRLFFYIGEWGGACGHTSTLRSLHDPRLFEPVEVKTPLVQFDCIHDDLWVYRRTSHPWIDQGRSREKSGR